MKTTYELYQDSYGKFTPDWFEDELQVNRYLRENSESIIDFFKTYCQQFDPYASGRLDNLKVLDLGCGLGGVSFEFAKRGAEVTGVDISPLAIMGAKTISSHKKLPVNFQVLDVTKANLPLGEFDLIIDSHLLHCITNNSERLNYFEFVKRNLKSTGKFLLECMVYQKQMEIPADFMLDEDMVLHQLMGPDFKFAPIRKVPTAREVEEELVNSGMKLSYFYVHSELSFEIYQEEHHKLPHTIRAVLTLNKNK